ncbi:MAG: PAC2 family protein [Thermodesulfobacteriota bacterium]|nr:PAC2 family protein [Thermodesulfobacteriota bacterium]
MGIKLQKKPKLKNPDLIVGWPGIGNIGIIAINTLRGILKAEEFGEIEPWDFFYPRKISFKAGVLEDLEFPGNRFYFKKTPNKDLIFFIGEEQPADIGEKYAKGGEAYKMANLVLDVGQKFGCKRIFTSGAAVASIHHTMKPKVWAVPNKKELIDEVKMYENIVLMSEVEGRSGQGSISGLNGLLLGVAKKRGLEGICIMGEIPIYVYQFPISYPKASKSVLEVLTKILKIDINLSQLDSFIQKMEREIDEIYMQLPTEIIAQLDKLKDVLKPEKRKKGMDDKQFMEKIDKLFEDIEQSFKEGGGKTG